MPASEIVGLPVFLIRFQCVFGLAASLDQVGPITRSARDALFLLSTVAGHELLDSTSQPSMCMEVLGIDASFLGLRVP